jgi:hypothetical protein
VVAGCSVKEEPPAPETKAIFEFNVRPYVGGQLLKLHQNMPGFLGRYRINVELFKLYIADVFLIKEDNSLIAVKDIELLDLEKTGKTQHGPGLYFQVAMPIGKYKGIKFGIGVPPSKNQSNPANYPREHPLSIFQGTHWDWNTGYRFVMLEAKLDTSKTQNQVPNFPIAYHLGTNDLYQTYEWLAPSSMPFEVKQNKELRFVVEMDINRWFTQTGNAVDPIQTPASHSMGAELPIAQKITNNMKTSLDFFSELVTP